MRTLQYIMIEQIAVLRVSVRGLYEMVVDDILADGGSDAKENFVKDLKEAADHLEQAQKLIMKHREAPRAPGDESSAEGRRG